MGNETKSGNVFRIVRNKAADRAKLQAASGALPYHLQGHHQSIASPISNHSNATSVIAHAPAAGAGAQHHHAVGGANLAPGVERNGSGYSINGILGLPEANLDSKRKRHDGM